MLSIRRRRSNNILLSGDLRKMNDFTTNLNEIINSFYRSDAICITVIGVNFGHNLPVIPCGVVVIHELCRFGSLEVLQHPL